LAFSKQHKTVLLSQYTEWARESQAIFILEYKKMSVKDINELRAKVRDAGGQFHVVKNTVMELAMSESGIHAGKELDGNNLFAFAIKDAPAVAKVLSDATAKSEIFKVKYGYLDGREITAADIKALAELPPLPVMRAKLLGLLQTPASQLVRTLAEPARQVAYVIKAYSEKGSAPAEA